MNIDLIVRGQKFKAKEEILKKSPYFEKMFDWNGLNDLEIDNDPIEFGQFLDFLKGENENPGPLGEFYMVGQCQEIISDHGNLIELANEPLDIIDRHNISFDAIYFETGMKYKNHQKAEFINKNFSSPKKEFKIEGNTIMFAICESKAVDWIENYKFVTNRKIKRIKISYMGMSLKNPEIVVFDEPNHDFMAENLKKVVPCYPYLWSDCYLEIEVELYDGTFDPWLQIIYDLGVGTIETKKWFARIQNGNRYYLNDFGKVYSDHKVRGNEIIKDLGPKYYNKIIYRYKYKKYLGKIDKITDFKGYGKIIKDNYCEGKECDFLLSKENGDITVSFISGSHNNVYCTFNRLNNKDDDYYPLNINFVTARVPGPIIQFDKKTDVWLIAGKEFVYEY
jgi:hypothetical protein